MSKSTANRRERLWRRDPRCTRCGATTWSPRARTEACSRPGRDFQPLITAAERGAMATLLKYSDPPTLVCWTCSQAAATAVRVAARAVLVPL